MGHLVLLIYHWAKRNVHYQKHSWSSRTVHFGTVVDQGLNQGQRRSIVIIIGHSILHIWNAIMKHSICPLVGRRVILAFYIRSLQMKPGKDIGSHRTSTFWQELLYQNFQMCLYLFTEWIFNARQLRVFH